MKQIPLSQGKFTIVDDEDYDALMKYKWWFAKCRSEFRAGYAARSVRVDGKKKCIMMHRYLMGLSWDTSVQIDHIDGNGLNNQKGNLRICNNSQNHMNQRPPKHNTSGVTGVSFDAKHNCYNIYINVNRKRYRAFRKTFEEARAARIELEIKHFGEFRRNEADKIS